MPIAETQFADVAPWPEAKPAIAGLHHNKPPLEELIPAEFRAKLLEDKPEFLTKFDAGLGAVDRVKVEDDESLARCGDLVNLYRAQIAHINATHKVVKEPYLTGGRLVDAERNALVEKAEAAKREVEAIGNEYVAKQAAIQKAERDRIAAEERAAAEAAAAAERQRIEAERQAAQAARAATNEVEREAAETAAAQARKEAEEAQQRAALAAAQVTTKAEPVRSDAGASVSSKQEWCSDVEDYLKAFKHVKDDPKVREAIDAAIKRLVRAGKRELVGVRIWPVAKGNYR